MTDYTISSKLSNETVYACYRGRFWRWDGSIWKESHLMTQKFERARAADKNLTPQAFLTNGAEFAPLDEYEIDCAMLDALENAKPCKNAPIEPVEENPTPSAQCSDAATAAESQTAASPAAPEGSSPTTELATAADAPGVPVSADENAPVPSSTAPTFDFGADEQTNALLLQDAQTFITGNMARIMAAKHAHDLCANNKNGTWGKWCDVVGISRDTGDNMVHIAEQFGNIQIEGKPIFDVQPLKLLYAAAKSSAPQVLVEQVKTGDITTYKEYQELLAQIKAERERAQAAESHLEAARADVEGLTQQNAELRNQAYTANEDRIAANLQRQKAEARAQDAENQLAGSRQVAAAARLRADKWQAEAESLKKQPITAVVDEEEVERQARKLFADMADEEVDRRAHQQAYSIAADMTEELKADKARLQKNMDELKQQLAEAQAVVPADLIADKETADSCYLNIDGIWGMALPSFQRLVGTGEDFNHAAGNLLQLCDHIHEELVKMTITNDKETLYD